MTTTSRPLADDLPDDDLAMLLTGACLLYTSDAADERSSVDLGGRRIIKQKKKKKKRKKKKQDSTRMGTT